MYMYVYRLHDIPVFFFFMANVCQKDLDGPRADGSNHMGIDLYSVAIVYSDLYIQHLYPQYIHYTCHASGLDPPCGADHLCTGRTE